MASTGRALRFALPLSAALALSWAQACSKKQSPSPPPPEAPAATASPGTPTAPSDVRAEQPAVAPQRQDVTAQPPSASNEQRPRLSSEEAAKAKVALATFNRLLNEGRKLARDGSYDEAMARFDKALEVAPGHPAAVGEHGWAAFNAGKLDVAARMTRLALANAKKPRRKAALLYNLGRVLEARGQASEARPLYERSLSLRPNEVVKQRLARLAADAQAAAGTGLDDMCKAAMEEWFCTPGGDPDDEDIGDCRCEPLVQEAPPQQQQGIKAAALLTLSGHGGLGGDLDGTQFLAVQGPDGAWAFAQMVANKHDPGVAYVHNDASAELDLADHLDAPGLELIVRTRNNTYDMNPGIGSYDDDTVRHWILCRAAAKEVRCVSLQSAAEFETGPLEPFDGEADDEQRDDVEASRSAWELTITLQRDGKVAIVAPEVVVDAAGQQHGDPVPDEVAAMAGTHTLSTLEAMPGVEMLTAR